MDVASLRCRSYHKAASASPTEASVSARRRSISASSEVERCDCGHPPKIPRQTHRIKRIIVCFAGYFPTRSIPVCGRNDAAPHGLRWRTGVARRLRAHSKVFQGAAILEWLTCCLYVTIMVIKGAALKTANISELKSRLSSYLADVQRGEEIIVRDRNRPVARLAPLTTARGGDAEEAALVASGVLRLPLDEKLPPAFWTKSRSSLTESRAARVVRRERDED